MGPASNHTGPVYERATTATLSCRGQPSNITFVGTTVFMDKGAPRGRGLQGPLPPLPQIMFTHGSGEPPPPGYYAATINAGPGPDQAATGVEASTASPPDPREQLIASVNNHPGVLWRAGANPRFAGLPVGAAAAMCGVLPESPAVEHALEASGEVERIERIEDFMPPMGADPLPESFDAAASWPHCAKVITDIRDQSACGSCWAVAAAGVASDRLCIATNGSLQMPLSAQDMAFCSDIDGCHGGIVINAWIWMRQHGLVTGGQVNGSGPFGAGYCSAYSLPHCHHLGPNSSDPYPRCPVQHNPACPKACDPTAIPPHNAFGDDKYGFEGNVKIFDTEEVIAAAVRAGGSVEASFRVFEDLEVYAKGIYHHVKGRQLGAHAVRIIGWGVEDGIKYWKIANSWNRFWGEDGFFRVRRGTNECGIEEGAIAPESTATWGRHKHGPATGHVHGGA
jgi:cathepsin B